MNYRVYITPPEELCDYLRTFADRLPISGHFLKNPHITLMELSSRRDIENTGVLEQLAARNNPFLLLTQAMEITHDTSTYRRNRLVLHTTLPQELMRLRMDAFSALARYASSEEELMIAAGIRTPEQAMLYNDALSIAAFNSYLSLGPVRTREYVPMTIAPQEWHVDRIKLSRKKSKWEELRTFTLGQQT
jgi:hypothetical protein